MDLLTIFRVLYRRIKYLIGIPMIAVVTAFLLTAGYPKIYRSTGQLATGFTVTKEINLTGEGYNIYESGAKFNNLIETLTSVRVLSLVSYRLLIHDLSGSEGEPFTQLELEKEEDINFVNSLDLSWITTFCQNQLDSMQILNTYNSREKDIERLMEFYKYDVESVKSMVFARRVNNTDYVSVDAFTESPLLSAYVVNAVISEFLRFNNRIINAEKSDAIETYANLVSEKRTELNRATARLQSFKARNSMINSELERENIVSRISDIEDELKEERQELRAKNLQLEDINRRLSGITSSGVTNADLVKVRNRISSLNERIRDDDSQALKDSLRILRDTQQRYIQMLSEGNFNRSFDELMESKNTLEVDIEIIRQNIADLESSVSRSGSEIGGFASKEASIASLEREVNLASEDYRDAQENYSLALSYSVSSGNSISQILLGLPAKEPEPSKRLIVSAVSGLSTFVFIVLIIVVLEYLDVSIKNARNFVDKTGLQLFGSLNHVNAADRSQKDGGADGDGESSKVKSILTKYNPASTEAKSKSINFLNVFKNISQANPDRLVFRDQLRKIRYALLSSNKNVILFTSTKEGEGKTSLITALASSLNQSQLKVLIFDTNFAHPSLTRRFKGLKVLEEFFRHKKKSESKTSKDFTAMFANSAGLEYVDILGCKGGDYTPIEIIKGDSLVSLIEDVKDKYDFIFFEGAALNSNSGSRELSSYVDGVVTVFSAKSTLSQLDYESIEFIKSLGEKNIGSVLNDVELRDMNTN